MEWDSSLAIGSGSTSSVFQHDPLETAFSKEFSSDSGGLATPARFVGSGDGSGDLPPQESSGLASHSGAEMESWGKQSLPAQASKASRNCSKSCPQVRMGAVYDKNYEKPGPRISAAHLLPGTQCNVIPVYTGAECRPGALLPSHLDSAKDPWGKSSVSAQRAPPLSKSAQVAGVL
jgi:hypothetical protein